jgi:hypothetical protein
LLRSFERRGRHIDAGSLQHPRRHGIEVSIGLREANPSLDLGNRRGNPQLEGLPVSPLGAMNGIDKSPSGGAATPKTQFRRFFRRDPTFCPEYFQLFT